MSILILVLSILSGGRGHIDTGFTDWAPEIYEASPVVPVLGLHDDQHWVLLFSDGTVEGY